VVARNIFKNSFLGFDSYFNYDFNSEKIYDHLQIETSVFVINPLTENPTLNIGWPGVNNFRSLLILLNHSRWNAN